MRRWMMAAASPLASLLLALPAGAAEIDWMDVAVELGGPAAACVEQQDPGPRYANLEPRRDSLALMARMLGTDAATCPGAAAQAAGIARRLLGNPEAPDAEPELLRLMWMAAERGLGTARDTALADRLGRLLWLYDDIAPPRWPETERQAWLELPETRALLEARAAQRGRAVRTETVVRRLAALRLRRDLPGYDPAGAIALLDDDWLLIGDEKRIAFSRLVTSGAHGPPDFARARRALILFGSMGVQATGELQSELLRVGRLAATRARTPAERAVALRLLFAAAIDDGSEEVAAREALVLRLGRVPTVMLTPGDAERIRRDMHREFTVRLGYPRQGDPAALTPIRLRGLIAPDGKLALAQVIGSSGLRRRDRSILAAWAEEHDRADLSETARGRFVWVELPPVDPLLRL